MTAPPQLAGSTCRNSLVYQLNHGTFIYVIAAKVFYDYGARTVNEEKQKGTNKGERVTFPELQKPGQD
ncbi:MAG: hypothetical protein HZC13_05685 [Nitrospirae bacterium]|nr:hypothetical protein [Nitrospirota bacterium]